MSKENPLNVSVGDIVHIDFRSPSGENPEFDARVTEIVKRYQSDMIVYEFAHERDAIANVEKFERLNMEPLPLGCDVSYITHIVQRAPFKKGCNVRENVYYSNKRKAEIRGLYHVNKHVLKSYGGLHYLIGYLFKGKDVDVPYGLAEEGVIWAAWEKANLPGLISTKNRGDWGTYYLINKKHFMRWLMRAIPHIRRNKKTWEAAEREHEKIMEESFEHDAMRDYLEG